MTSKLLDTSMTSTAVAGGSAASKEPNGKAAARVFAIPELAEAILLNVRFEDLITVNRTSKDINNTIIGSPKLQHMLGFQLLPQDDKEDRTVRSKIAESPYAINPVFLRNGLHPIGKSSAMFCTYDDKDLQRREWIHPQTFVEAVGLNAAHKAGEEIELRLLVPVEVYESERRLVKAKDCHSWRRMLVSLRRSYTIRATIELENMRERRRAERIFGKDSASVSFKAGTRMGEVMERIEEEYLAIVKTRKKPEPTAKPHPAPRTMSDPDEDSDYGSDYESDHRFIPRSVNVFDFDDDESEHDFLF